MLAHYHDYGLNLNKESISDNMEDEFLYGIETEILPLNQIASEKLHDPILSKIVS